MLHENTSWNTTSEDEGTPVADGVSTSGVEPAGGVVPTQSGVARASTWGIPNAEDNTSGELNRRQLRTIKRLALVRLATTAGELRANTELTRLAVISSLNFDGAYNNGEHLVSSTAFAYATGRLHRVIGGRDAHQI